MKTGLRGSREFRGFDLNSQSEIRSCDRFVQKVRDVQFLLLQRTNDKNDKSIFHYR